MSEINKGDRFITKDKRDEGRIVEVREVRLDGEKFLIETEVHPNNPSAVGRKSVVKRDTLRHRYERINR